MAGSSAAALPLENGVKDLQVVDAAESAALMFERLARDPNASVEKIERLMALWERGEARKAEAAFNAAMTLAQRAMRPVAADADNPQTCSKYASYAQLDRALRPIYTDHGFGLSFDTADGAADQWVRVVCYVTHSDGHSRTYRADMPADGKGAKGGDVMTKTHAVGAAMSYGMRYLLKMIFNVAVGEDDDDGNSNGGVDVPAAPRGFQEWWDDMAAAVDNGLPSLENAWAASRRELKEYAHKYRRQEWSTMKAKAEKARS